MKTLSEKGTRNSNMPRRLISQQQSGLRKTLEREWPHKIRLKKKSQSRSHKIWQEIEFRQDRVSDKVTGDTLGWVRSGIGDVIMTRSSQSSIEGVRYQFWGFWMDFGEIICAIWHRRDTRMIRTGFHCGTYGKIEFFGWIKRLEERKKPILIAYHFGLCGNSRNYNANVQGAPSTIIRT